MVSVNSEFSPRCRYSTLPITSENRWNSANKAFGAPKPKIAGSTQNFTVSGLLTYTKYYFAIKTADARYNWSLLSNYVSATTMLEYTAVSQNPTVPPPTSTIVPATPAVSDIIYIDIKGKRGVIFLTLLSDGTLAKTTIITLNERQLEMTIQRGTILLDKNGKPINVIVLELVEPYGSAPPGFEFLATYDFQPSCVIEPALAVKMMYDRQKLKADVNENDIHIAYYNQTQSRWVSLATMGDTANQAVKTSTTHFSLFSLVVPKSKMGGVSSNATIIPQLNVTGLTLSSNVIEQGESLIVTVDVLNEGDTEGEFYLRLLYNGTTLDEKIINLMALQEKEETFTVMLEEEGTHTIGVGSMLTTVTVKKHEASLLDDLGRLRTPLIWGSIAGLAIVFIVVLINRWRKNKTAPRRL